MKFPPKRAWFALVLFGSAMGLLLFLPAGTIRYWQAWVYLAVFIGGSALTMLDLMRRDPALLQRRLTGGPREEKRPAQRFMMLCSAFGFKAILIVSALDYRFGWSAVPFGGVVAGDVLVAVGLGLTALVFRANTFASATVEIAENQTVISTGPYAIVRHPMYASALFYLFGTPLALGSYWGLAPVAVVIPCLVWRILDEEHFLGQNLAGYADYQTRIRHRLVPLVW